MPQLWLEVSGNISQPVLFDDLFARLHEAVARTAGVSVGACKSRAVSRDTFRVGEGAVNGAFVHLEVGLLSGRTPEQHREVAAACLEVLADYYAPSLQALDVQVTVEVRAMERESYQKVSSS
ncbi:MAG: 5-carboxymethyl-2-hydroxymuconate Delta-isomerase [Lentisphaeria bacterium]|nr:5-carboxymethyl-2-hydroxymuconate Delta-isomerase [Lentisphaeria bacterium]